MKKYVPSIVFIVGFGILTFIFCVVALVSLAFLLGGGVHPIWVVLSLLAAGGLVYWLLRKHDAPKPLVWLALFVVLLVGSVGLSSTILDPSWDGNSYHKTAIGQLAHGWNPLRQDVNSFNASNENSLKIMGMKGLDRAFDTPWINHYPKGSWMFAASMYRVTGNIESGKALTPLVMIALFLLAFGYLCQKLKRNQALVLSLLLACNPITVMQFYSYYVDGLMGNLLIILLLALTMLIDTKSKVPSRRLLLYGIIGMSATLAMNVKFTGVAYVGIIMACYWLFLLATRQWQLLKHLTYVGIAVVIVGVCLIGAPTYIKNTISNGHPLYPLMGKGSVNFIVIEEPQSYEHMSHLHQFIKANLSPTMQYNREQALLHGEPGPKVPFTVSPDEIKVLSNVDVRQGGYGVWFGGVLILSMFAGVYALGRYGRQRKEYLSLFLLPLATIGVCILAVDATWWARYLPQLVVFPVIVAAALYLRREAILPNILVFAMLFNVVLTGLVGLDAQSKYQHEANQSLAQNLHCSDKEPVKIYSAIGLDGVVYNVHDRCKNIHLLTPDEFKNTPKENQVELLKGVYAIR